jgi:hypothetical protein
MFKTIDIKSRLDQLKEKNLNDANSAVIEAKRILQNDLFTEKKILENLKQYNKSFEVLDERDLDNRLVFNQKEIKQLCITYRLKFLDSTAYKPEIPYESVLKIKELNNQYKKDLKYFKILAPYESFAKKDSETDTILFTKTNHDNYYIIHRWGNKLPWYRMFKHWPMRNFETLFLSVIIIAIILALSLPIKLISLDPKAEYWSGYRAATFFHLLIFNMGVTAYITFAFAKNFSSSIWNRERDFD